LLQAAAWVFGGASGLRNRLFDAGVLRVARLEVPVISVGNLVVGGAGKTPVVIALAQRLVSRGKRVAVVSRGYGGTGGRSRVSDGERIFQTARECGDEPWLIANRVPGACVLVGAARAKVAREAVAELGAQVVLLDDGFQHRGLARDADILVLGGVAPLGNGRLLPAGPLREPWANARRATLAWLSNGAELPEAMALPRIRSRHRPTGLVHLGSCGSGLPTAADIRELSGKRVFLLAGIARPAGFTQTLTELGAEQVGSAFFRDHHRFTAAELELVDAEAARLGADFIATTEKDAARIELSAGLRTRWVAVRIDVEILEGEAVLGELLDRC